MRNERFHALGVLKFICVIGIVLFHVHTWFGDPFLPFLRSIYQYGGSIGNIFFFVSSGFLMAYHYRDRINHGEIDFGTYTKKRILSVLPLYLITNIVQYALDLYRGSCKIDLGQLFLSLIFVGEGWIGKAEPPNYPTWFVCVLILCNLVYYVVSLVGVSRTKYRVLLVAMILWGYICRSGRIDFPFCYNITGSGLFNYFIGCGLCELIFCTSGKVIHAFFAFELPFFLLTVVLTIVYGFQTVSSDTGFILSVVIIPVIIVTSVKSGCLNHLCDNRFCRHLAGLSTFIFFLHVPVFTVFRQFGSEVIGKYSSGAKLIIYLCLLIVTCEATRGISLTLSRKK